MEKVIKKPFSSEEMEALRINCMELRDRALIEFLYSTGVRVSELVALNVCDVEIGKQEGLEEQPLFVTLDKPHNRLTVAGIQYMLRQLGERAKVKNVHPHRFRRTVVTDLLSRGMPIEQVKEFLGHEKLDTTMIYCSVKEENVQASHRKYA